VRHSRDNSSSQESELYFFGSKEQDNNIITLSFLPLLFTRGGRPSSYIYALLVIAIECGEGRQKNLA